MAPCARDLSPLSSHEGRRVYSQPLLDAFIMFKLHTHSFVLFGLWWVIGLLVHSCTHVHVLSLLALFHDLVLFGASGAVIVDLNTHYYSWARLGSKFILRDSVPPPNAILQSIHLTLLSCVKLFSFLSTSTTFYIFASN